MARNFRTRTTNRPNRGWSSLTNATYTAVPVASKVLLGSFTVTLDLDETILRTVGILSIVTDNSAASEEQIGAFGMILVTDAALAVGVTAMPGPVTDADDDGWMLYVPFSQTIAIGAAGVIESKQYSFDFRGKRIVRGGVNMAIMIENAHATNAFDASVMLRLLSQLRGTG